MIRLATENFTVDSNIIRKYNSPYPALIYGYLSTFNDLQECTVEDLCWRLSISKAIQNKWVKQLLKDGLIDCEGRGLHNKRYLGIKNNLSK